MSSSLITGGFFFSNFQRVDVIKFSKKCNMILMGLKTKYGIITFSRYVRKTRNPLVSVKLECDTKSFKYSFIFFGLGGAKIGTEEKKVKGKMG